MDSRLSILSPPPNFTATSMRREEAQTSHHQHPYSLAEFPNHRSPGLSLGLNLGPIDPKILRREAWPLHTAQEMIQYRKFTRLMINRIRVGESDDEDIGRFTNMFGGVEGWVYALPALGMLPELEENGPEPQNGQMSRFLQQVKNIVKARDRERIAELDKDSSGHGKPPLTVDYILRNMRANMAKLLFGSDDENRAAPAMKRLLTSWVETGYPGHDKRGSSLRASRDVPFGLGEQHFLQNTPKTKGNSAPIAVPPGRQSPKPCPIDFPTLLEPNKSGLSDSPEKPEQKTFGRQVPTSILDSSPELLEERPSPEKQVKHDDSTITLSGGGSNPPNSFWHFHRSHQYDYEKYIRPVTEADRIRPCPDKKKKTPISTKKTKEGTLVATGFQKPDPKESDEMLKAADTCVRKTIEKSAAKSSITSTLYADETAFPAVSSGDTSSSEEARRRSRAARKEAMAKIDELDSDAVYLVSPIPPEFLKSLPSTKPDPPEVLDKNSPEGGGLGSIGSELETMDVAGDERGYVLGSQDSISEPLASSSADEMGIGGYRG
ncbi:MAG: hypothetical protein Q9219_004744 [cf. Caloplaca sp. 3 TL-2023]